MSAQDPLPLRSPLLALFLLSGLLLIGLTPPPVAAQSAVQPDKIRLQLEWVYQFQYAGFIAAKEKGFYREAGLDVELLEYKAGMDVVERVLQGEVDYGIHNSSVVMRGSRVVPVVLLATYLQQSPLVLLTRKTIDHPAQLVGKHIMGTAAELQHSAVAHLLDHFFINEDNAEFVEHTFDITDFTTGRVDAITAFRSNQPFLLDQFGVRYNVIDPADYGFYATAVNVFAAPEQVERNPERAQRFIEASNRGWAYALDNTEEIINLIVERYSQHKSRDALRYEAEVTRQMMDLAHYEIGQVNPAQGDRAYQQLRRAQLARDLGESGTQTLDEVMQLRSGGLELLESERQHLLEKGRLVMCVDPDWMPLEALSDNRYVGIAADIYADMISPLLPVPIEVYPSQTWVESLDAVQARTCDLLSLAVPTASRRRYLNFTQPYIRAPLVLATAMDKPFVENLQQIEERRIGVVRGYAFGELLRERQPNLKVVDVESIMDGLKRVENGELYGYVDNLISISANIQQGFPGQLKISARLDDHLPLAVGVRNDDPVLFSIFERAIQHINAANKDKQRILSDWISVRQDVAIDYDLIWQALLVLALVGAAFAFHYSHLWRYNRRLRQISETDALTGLYNRLRADDALLEAQEALRRYQVPCGLIMLDIDHFKRINDRFGHSTGDRVLVDFAAILKQNSRATDKIFRWGGEEFLILCPHMDIDGTEAYANRLLNEIRQHRFPHGRKVTASLGVGAFDSDQDVMSLVDRVDQALYEAKRNDRNQVNRFDFATAS